MFLVEYENILHTAIGIIVILIIIKWDLVSYLYDLRIDNHHIEFMLFKTFCIYTLQYSNILRVKKVRWGGITYLMAYNWSNRFFKDTYLIEKKKGIFTKSILITPSKNDVEKLKQTLAMVGIEYLDLKRA